MASALRKSPRKNAASARTLSATTTAITQLKRTRAPPRCRQCPGNPLKSTCPCTRKTRKKPTAPEVSSDIPEPIVTPLPITPLDQPVTEIPDSVIDPVLLNTPAPPSNTGHEVAETLHPPLSTPEDHAPLSPFSHPLPGLFSSTNASRTSVEDDGDLGPSSPFPSSSDDTFHVPSSPSPHAPCTPSSGHSGGLRRARQVSVPAGESQHGSVEGSMQGPHPLAIRRPSALPGPIETTSTAIQRHGRVIRELLIKAERIAHETNSWLIIAAQHPNAHTEFIHYTSPRLRHDAIERSGELVSSFGDLVADLRQAREKSAYDISQMYQEKLKKQDMEMRAQAEALDAKQAQIDYLLTLTSQYKQTLERENALGS